MIVYSLIKEKDLWNNNFAVLFLGKEARLDLSPLLFDLSKNQDHLEKTMENPIRSMLDKFLAIKKQS